MNDFTRFEIMPFACGEHEAVELPEPARLTVTCSPTQGLDRTLELAMRLRARGHALTVHLAARMVRDRTHLDGLLAALAQAGVDDIFLIGGDAAAPCGEYSSALELLPLIHSHPHRPRRIGIAGYPEGHPLIDSRSLEEALREKSRLADYIVTQLCFNPKAALEWAQAMRQAVGTLPIFVGLPGIVDRRKLIEISMRVGVGPSIAFLRKQGLRNLVRLSASTTESLYEALAPSVGDPALGLAGFHYFTFNRLVDTWRWARERSRARPVDSQSQKEMTQQ